MNTNLAIAALMLLAVSGCMPAPAPEIVWVDAPLEQTAQTEARQRIKPKDRVRVMAQDGKWHVFDVHSCGVDGFVGVSPVDGKTKEIAYASLTRMEVSRLGVGICWTCVRVGP